MFFGKIPQFGVFRKKTYKAVGFPKDLYVEMFEKVFLFKISGVFLDGGQKTY